MAHNFKLELPAQKLEKTLFATNLQPGETRTASYTFPTAGAWEMYCPVDDHEGMGMKGAIQVLGAAASGMPHTGVPTLDGFAGLLVGACLLLGAGLWLRRWRLSAHWMEQ